MPSRKARSTRALLILFGTPTLRRPDGFGLATVRPLYFTMKARIYWLCASLFFDWAVARRVPTALLAGLLAEGADHDALVLRERLVDLPLSFLTSAPLFGL